uniref:Uncharacterized protein n=1 Tax=Anguilla anguilla TaxID=7936 RepID=A0A0E9RQA3_ANGAN
MFICSLASSCVHITFDCDKS